MSSRGTGRRGRRGAILRRVALGLCVVIGACTVAGVLLWRSATRPPRWWEGAAVPNDAPTVERGAALERGVVSALHEVRPSQDAWTVELREADANAWLAHRLPKWLANRGESLPREFSGARVAFRDGEVVVGVEVRTGPGEGDVRHTGVRLRPELGAEGLRLADVRVFLGRLDLSRGAAERLGGKAAASAIDRAMRLLGAAAAGAAGDGAESGELVIAEPVVTLEDGRRVRLVALLVEEGRLLMTCETAQAGSDR